MKQFWLWGTALLLVSCNLAQPEVEASLVQLITDSMSGEYGLVAQRIVYRGPDKARNWKDVCDITKEGDASRISEVGIKLFEFLSGTDGKYRVTRYSTETEPEGTFHVLKVEITANEGIKTVHLAFLDVGGTYALADID